MPLVVGVSRGDVVDADGLKPMVAGLLSRHDPGRGSHGKPRKLHADKAYDTTELRRWLRVDWDWVTRFAAQEPRFGRGTNNPIEAVAARDKAIGVGTFGSITPFYIPEVQWIAPEGHPFMA